MNVIKTCNLIILKFINFKRNNYIVYTYFLNFPIIVLIISNILIISKSNEHQILFK